MNKTKVIFRMLTISLFMGLVIPACEKDDMGRGGRGGGGKWIDSTRNHEDSTDSSDSSGNGGGGQDSTDSTDSTGNGGVDSTDSSGNGGADSTGNNDSTGLDFGNGNGGEAPELTGSIADSVQMTLRVWEYKPAKKKDAYGNDLYIMYGKVYSWDGQYPAEVNSNSNLISSYTDQYYFWDGSSWAKRNL